MNSKQISKQQIINNALYCQSKHKKIMVMVKADAYGHGMKNVATILKNKVNFWGVANLQESLTLKKMLNKNHTILIVGKQKQYKLAIKNNIHFTIDCLQDLENAIKEARKAKAVAKVHIAINTGMNRIGTKQKKEFLQMLQEIKSNKSNIKLCGVFTHCFDADCVNSHFKSQMKKFKSFVNLIKQKNVLVHIGGSFCLNYNIPKFVNMVRVGYFIYGYGNKNLKPAMSICSKITKTIICKRGEYVGYGATKLKQYCKIAIIPLGYADGVPRRLGNIGTVCINGKMCKIIGNPCMDMLMVDITNVNAKVGDKVIIFDNAEKWAKLLQTSPYEVLTNFISSRTKCLII